MDGLGRLGVGTTGDRAAGLRALLRSAAALPLAGDGISSGADPRPGPAASPKTSRASVRASVRACVRASIRVSKRACLVHSVQREMMWGRSRCEARYLQPRCQTKPALNICSRQIRTHVCVRTYTRTLHTCVRCMRTHAHDESDAIRKWHLQA